MGRVGMGFERGECILCCAVGSASLCPSENPTLAFGLGLLGLWNEIGCTPVGNKQRTIRLVVPGVVVDLSY
jgi:hypothetical protein